MMAHQHMLVARYSVVPLYKVHILLDWVTLSHVVQQQSVMVLTAATMDISTNLFLLNMQLTSSVDLLHLFSFNSKLL